MIARLLLRHVSPEGRRTLAVWTFDVSVVGWPLSHVGLWTFAGETSLMEHFILALSWFAITATAFDTVQTSDVRVEQDES